MSELGEKLGKINEERAKEIEVVDAVVVKKQKKSVSYGLKAFGKHVKHFAEIGLIDGKDVEALEKIKSKMIMKYMQDEF